MAAEKPEDYVSLFEIPKLLARLKKEMREAASRLDFEKAAELRDRIKTLQQQELDTRETGLAEVAK
jgi:excinuclease ABC subunit B